MKSKTPKSRGFSRVSLLASRRELLSRINFDAQFFVLAGIIIIAVVSALPEIQIWYEQRVTASDLQKQNESTKESLIQMKEDLKRWDDPVYIRAQARNRLFYVMPGEISFTVMDINSVNATDSSGTVGAALAAQRNSTSLSKKVSTTKANWTQNLVETVVRAGIEQPKN